VPHSRGNPRTAEVRRSNKYLTFSRTRQTRQRCAARTRRGPGSPDLAAADGAPSCGLAPDAAPQTSGPNPPSRVVAAAGARPLREVKPSADPDSWRDDPSSPSAESLPPLPAGAREVAGAVPPPSRGWSARRGCSTTRGARTGGLVGATPRPERVRRTREQRAERGATRRRRRRSPGFPHALCAWQRDAAVRGRSDPVPYGPGRAAGPAIRTPFASSSSPRAHGASVDCGPRAGL
jgi:hypothetical protein